MGFRFAAAPAVFKQGTAPDSSADIPPTPGDLWMDLSQTPPVAKKCTAINPFVWASIEGGGGAVINFADGEVPAGAIPGTVYTLAHTPNPALSLELYRNGLVQKGGGVDYTLSTATITFVATTVAGDLLLAWYRF